MPRAKAEPKYARLTSEERRAELIEAGLACMGRGGIQEFTVDRICVQAGVSRGLIAHHFGSMNGLLAAIYARMYSSAMPTDQGAGAGRPRIAELIDGFFAPEIFNREELNIWLTLWGQVSNNPELKDEHRRQYGLYLGEVSGAIAELAQARDREVDARALARTLICLVDGLGLQHCIDAETLSAAEARAACHAFLNPHLGPLE